MDKTLIQTTINAMRYRQQLNKLEAEIIKKCLFSGKIYFQHDNAKSNVTNIVKEKIAKFGWELLSNPPYSPDLAPSDYHLLRSLSNDLKDRQFEKEKIHRYLGEYIFD